MTLPCIFLIGFSGIPKLFVSYQHYPKLSDIFQRHACLYWPVPVLSLVGKFSLCVLSVLVLPLHFYTRSHTLVNVYMLCNYGNQRAG